jgi:hypothetical protein
VSYTYENIVGSNDRISLGYISIGSRGDDLGLIVSKLKSSHRVEMTAVCDLWKVNREKAVATNISYYGRAPRAVQYVEELLSMKEPRHRPRALVHERQAVAQGGVLAWHSGRENADTFQTELPAPLM